MARPWWSNRSEGGKLTSPATVDPSLEQGVIALVQRWAEMDRPVRTTDRLLDDLGIDGDDAVELFEAFSGDFGVCLDDLYPAWSTHFGPEGFPLRIGATMVVIAGSVGAAVAMTGLPGWLSIAIAMAAGFGWQFGLRAWPFGGPPLEPVTVADMIEAAQAGRWVKRFAPA
jgi:acyl carrier protein